MSDLIKNLKMFNDEMDEYRRTGRAKEHFVYFNGKEIKLTGSTAIKMRFLLKFERECSGYSKSSVSTEEIIIIEGVRDCTSRVLKIIYETIEKIITPPEKDRPKHN